MQNHTKHHLHTFYWILSPIQKVSGTRGKIVPLKEDRRMSPHEKEWEQGDASPDWKSSLTPTILFNRIEGAYSGTSNMDPPNTKDVLLCII